MITQVACYIAFQFPSVQTWAGKKVINSLSESINGKIDIGKIYIIFFNKVILNDVAITSTEKSPLLDSLKKFHNQSDTLLSCNKISVSIEANELLKFKIKLKSVAIKDGVFNLQTENENSTNLDRIFKINKDTPKDSTKKSIFDPIANKVKITNFRFSLNNPYGSPSKGDSTINFSKLYLSNINANISDIHLKKDTIFANINNIGCIDKSGFKIKKLSCNIEVSNTETITSNLKIEDDFSHINAKYFYLKYKSIKDFNDFVNLVKMGGYFNGTYINFKTIGKIAPAMKNSNLAFYINGEASGTVSNLKANKIIVTSESGKTNIQLNAKIVGLPNITSTMMLAKIDTCSTTSGDIAKIIASINNKKENNFISSISPNVTYNFRGDFSGLVDDFVANGKINSSIGSIDLDVLFKNLENKTGFRIDGNITTEGFNLGNLLPNSKLGKLSMNSSINAIIKDEKMGGHEISIKNIDIKQLDFNDYSYSNVFATGKYTNSFFDGKIICHDPNLDFIFQGLFSFNNDSTNRYDFYANIPHANLAKLNLDKRDSVSIISLVTSANFVRNETKDIIGNIDIENTFYQNSRGEFKIGNINISSLKSGNTFSSSLEAPFAKAKYSGASPIFEFLGNLKNSTINNKLNNLFGEVDSTKINNFKKGYYKFNIKTFNTMGICEMLIPGLYIMNNTNVDVTLDKNNDFNLVVNSGRLAYKANYLKDLKLTLSSKDTLDLKANLEVKNTRFAGVGLDSTLLNISANNNIINTKFEFKNDSTENSRATILSNIEVLPNKKFLVNINENSLIDLKGEIWRFSPSNIFYSDSTILIDHFNINNNNQQLSINGNIDKFKDDSLEINLANFNIDIINLFLNKSFEFKGLISGKSIISDVYRTPKILLDFTGDSISVYNTMLGSLKLGSIWNNNENRFDLSLLTQNDAMPNLTADGFYIPDSKYIDIKSQLNKFSLKYFEPFLDGIVSNTSGSLSGNLKLFGELDKLNLVSDKCVFNDYTFVVDFTQVKYRINGPAKLTENGIEMSNMPLYDMNGNIGYINGGLKYNYFKNIRFNTNINFNNLQCLNTNIKDNESFYGKAYGTGSLEINGTLNKIIMNINLLSNAKTSIHIPLSNTSTATKTNLLTFVNNDTIKWEDPYEVLNHPNTKIKTPTELDIRLITNITPQAEIFIDVNKELGDVIKANGYGNINMYINPSKNRFDILGDYNISQGSYKFVLAGLAAKDFIIEPGGSINFNGIIDNTNLNLTAVYKTKAAINTLIADTSSVSTRRIVDCEIEMAGKLTNPELRFNIDIPDLDPTTKLRVESALNTQGKIQKQFMALLISGGFIPDEQSGIANNSSILYSNASEIFSKQINNILQQLGIPLDLGLNYQPGERGTDIFDVAVSTQLFNNKVLINGNIGNDPYVNNNRNIIGNIDVEIKLDNSGNLRLNLFSHSVDQYSSYNDNNLSQRNGIGIAYQKEFNTFKELIKGKSKLQKEYEKQHKQNKKKDKEQKKETSKNNEATLKNNEEIANYIVTEIILPIFSIM